VSRAVIYVRDFPRVRGANTIQELNALDLRGMRKRWPNITSTAKPALGTRDKQTVPVHEFSGGQYLETVAYVDHPGSITVIVVSANTAASYRSALPTFRQVVSSYQWLPELL